MLRTSISVSISSIIYNPLFSPPYPLYTHLYFFLILYIRGGGRRVVLPSIYPTYSVFSVLSTCSSPVSICLLIILQILVVLYNIILQPRFYILLHIFCFLLLILQILSLLFS